MTEICMYCRATLTKGSHEFIAKIENQIVVIKDLPAMICTQCGEAYYDDAVMKKLDKIRNKINKGEFIAHPIAAGELTINDL